MKTKKRVRVRVAPYQHDVVCNIPTHLANSAMGVGAGLLLLDSPKTRQWKAVVCGCPGIWEMGDSMENAEINMKKRLEAEGLELINFIHETEPIR